MTHWFKKGLSFQCTECGKCCTGQPGYVWVTEQDIENMAKELNLSKKMFMRTYLRFKDNKYALIEQKRPPYNCVFLKNNRCAVYKARPKQCRTFPFWPHLLKSKEAWESAKKECEGINDQAPVVPYEQILQIASLKKDC